MRRAKSISIASAIKRTRQQEHARSKHGSAPAGHKSCQAAITCWKATSYSSDKMTGMQPQWMLSSQISISWHPHPEVQQNKAWYTLIHRLILAFKWWNMLKWIKPGGVQTQTRAGFLFHIFHHLQNIGISILYTIIDQHLTSTAVSLNSIVTRHIELVRPWRCASWNQTEVWSTLHIKVVRYKTTSTKIEMNNTCNSWVTWNQLHHLLHP